MRSIAVLHHRTRCAASSRALARAFSASAAFDVRRFIDDARSLTGADDVHLCDGSEQEKRDLVETLLSTGTIEELPARPGSYLARSDPRDVARVEKQTYICTENEEDAGVTNNWVDPKEMRATLHELFKGSMQGRTMYVVPFSMGPLGSDKSKLGIQVTDSPYVALSMGVMTRMGAEPLRLIEHGADTVPCYHTLGAPLAAGEKDVPWPCNDKKYIVHFPQEPSIWSYGSGYGGNALLGKKCLALRIASSLARQEGWLAEHMLIVGVTSPEGEKRYMAAAFPSACGKTNLAMLTPTLPGGWKVETVGDDIAWMKWGEDGRLYAINPENGFFGVAPGTSYETNPAAMKTIEKNTIFTNVARTDDGDVWWEGMGDAPPHLIDWHGNDWHRDQHRNTDAAHPNSRFAVPIAQCPTLDPAWQDPKGVPIDAILFGGRRASTVPLVVEAKDWAHGTLMGASVASEQTAAAEGKVGSLRHDPFAMLPFCGYNIADYFQHWLDVGAKGDPEKRPKIFTVNWFRKSEKDGSFLWPGFGENSRVLKWIHERCSDPQDELAQSTPIGLIPKEGALDTQGLELSPDVMKQLFEVDADRFQQEISASRKYFESLGERVPKELYKQLDSVEKELQESKS